MERAAETNEPKTEPKPLIVFLLLIPALTNLCPVFIVPLTLLAPFGDPLKHKIGFFSTISVLYSYCLINNTFYMKNFAYNTTKAHIITPTPQKINIDLFDLIRS